jgi:hypothetical protein
VLYVGAVEGLIGTTVGVKLDEPTPGAGTSAVSASSASLWLSSVDGLAVLASSADGKSVAHGF